MEQPPLPQLPPASVSFEDGILRAIDVGDVYFSAEDGLAESRYVFIDGSGALDALAHASHLIIAETGFGTGLNLLALCAAITKAGSSCQIDFISFEAAPLEAKDARLAHNAFPELTRLSHDLIANWPRRWHGVHRFSMLGGQVRVQLHYGQAEAALSRLSFAADFWFLDGFAPAKNPQIWSQPVCNEIARLSKKGTRLSSFTVARQVRTHLSEAGFHLEKAPGFGRKRDMLKGIYDKGFNRAKARPVEQVAIIGGGIAGAAMAYALAELNIPHFILEQANEIAPAASGNPAGLLVPFLSVGDMPAARLSISALADAQKFAERHQLISSPGVVSLDFSERKASRQAKISAQGFPEDLATYLTPKAVAEKIGIEVGMGGLYHAAGGVVSPPAYCTALMAGSLVHTNAGVREVSGEEGEWQIKCHDGQYFTASHIIYCGGAATPQLINDGIVPKKRFQITSGQLSYMPQDTALSPLKMAINYSGYLLPCGAGMQIAGAGFDTHEGAEITKEGHLQNLALMPEILQSLAASPDSYSGRRALRLSVADRLPVAGEISDTKYMLTALGARGLTLAGFLAHSLACRIAGRADFLEQPLAAALLPERLKEL